MKLKYDNVEDARAKLVGTYCMFKGKAILVKTLGADEEGKFVIGGVYMYNNRSMTCCIDEPEFNCYKYNIGYVNHGGMVAWFYRVPTKQYRQGLRYDQVRLKSTKGHFANINFQPGKTVCAMLENSYPSFEGAALSLRAMEAEAVAFHKDFAMTLDNVHKDLIIEYKGVNIGFTKNQEDFELMEEFAHLKESLKEAIG